MLVATHYVTYETNWIKEFMRIRTIFAVLTFGLSTMGFGQSYDPCKIGNDAAELAISRGKVYFPRLTIESSYTLRKMLELDYGIMDEIYDNGSDMSFEGEAECFFELMKTEIDERWGKDFLKQQSLIADSLDKEGTGYREPKENGIADTLTHYLKNEHLFDSDNKNYIIKITISGNKDIIDIKVLTGVPNATEISRDIDDYQFITEAIHKVDKVYEPGLLRGKTVESTLIFWIEL